MVISNVFLAYRQHLQHTGHPVLRNVDRHSSKCTGSCRRATRCRECRALVNAVSPRYACVARACKLKPCAMHAVTAMLRLQSRVEGPPDSIAVSTTKVIVGRLPCAADHSRWCLEHQDCPFLLSRQHATIELTGNGNLVVRDLGSLNGTFAASRPGSSAVRIPANVDWPLCPGSLLYFGAKDTVVSQDGTLRENPFVYLYEGPEAAPRHMQAAAETALQGTAEQEAAHPLKAIPAGPEPTLQLQPHASQQSQQHHQPTQQSPYQDLEAPVTKRRRLSEALRTQSAGNVQHQAAVKHQQDAAAATPAIQEAEATLHEHSNLPPSLELLDLAAPCQSAQQLQQVNQQQQIVTAGSEPEVLQPIKQQQQQQSPLDQIPQQQSQQCDNHHQSPTASKQQQQQQAEHLEHHPATDQQRRPLAELNCNRPQQQQTPSGIKNPAAAAAAGGKGVAAPPLPALSPGMRVSSSTLECAVCKEIMVAPHSLNCGHTFCGLCLSQWLERPEPTCPTCRAAVTYAPVLQRVIDSIISEAAVNQNSDMQERAARTEAWEAVKDVTTQYWRERFSGEDSSRGKGKSKPGSRTDRQQGRAGATAVERNGGRVRGSAEQQQQQQQHAVPAGVVTLLPAAHRRPAGGPAAAAAAGGGQQGAQQHAARRNQPLSAAAVPTATAVAGARPRNQRGAARRSRARGRGAAAAAGSRGMNPAGVASAVIQAQRQVESIARRMQARQRRQPPQRPVQQQAARPAASRQVAIDSFLAHAGRAVQP